MACNDILKAVEEGEEKSEEVVPAISTMLSKEWIGVDNLLLILIFILTRVPV